MGKGLQREGLLRCCLMLLRIGMYLLQEYSKSPADLWGDKDAAKGDEAASQRRFMLLASVLFAAGIIIRGSWSHHHHARLVYSVAGFVAFIARAAGLLSRGNLSLDHMYGPYIIRRERSYMSIAARGSEKLTKFTLYVVIFSSQVLLDECRRLFTSKARIQISSNEIDAINARCDANKTREILICQTSR